MVGDAEALQAGGAEAGVQPGRFLPAGERRPGDQQGQNQAREDEGRQAKLDGFVGGGGKQMFSRG